MQVTEELLWELLAQVAPVVSVYLPKDKVTHSSHHQGGEAMNINLTFAFPITTTSPQLLYRLLVLIKGLDSSS